MSISKAEKAWPKISIITISFNQGQFIENTIQSVISQNYPNLEYIIIDGGSIDNSVEIIKKYDRYLSYWISEPDKGMYHAVQKGFEKSTGEIMAWINSDDIYFPGALFIVAEIFSQFEEVNWIMGNPVSIDELGRFVRVYELRKWSKYNFYLYDYKYLQQESIFWRRIVWENSGSSLNLNFRYAGDFELWLRFFRYEQLYTTSSLLGAFRWKNRDQISLEKMALYIKEVEFAIENEEITIEDRKVLKGYIRIKKVVKLLGCLKIMKVNWLLNNYINNHFSLSKEINFVRERHRFEIFN